MIRIDGLKQLADKLRNSAKEMRNFRLDFYNWFAKEKEKLGIILRDEGRKEIDSLGLIDTKTMYKRMDYAMTDRWNKLVYGVFESDSKYYDSSRHYPTSTPSKYTGKTIPPDKQYAKYVHSKHPFLDKIKKEMVEEWVEQRIEYYKRTKFRPF